MLLDVGEEYSSDDRSDDPVKSWVETCKVLESSVEGLIDDAIERGVSLVLEVKRLVLCRTYHSMKSNTHCLGTPNHDCVPLSSGRLHSALQEVDRQIH